VRDRDDAIDVRILLQQIGPAELPEMYLLVLAEQLTVEMMAM
jgi:hypothetical protein